MKRVILLLSACIVSILSYAQSPFKALYSEAFDEPEVFNQTLVLGKNGATYVLSPQGKEAINVAIYDAGHKLVKNAQISAEQLGFPKVRALIIHRSFVIGTELVAFFEGDIRNEEPILVRALISPTDGSLIRKDQVCILPAELQSQGRAHHYIDVAQNYTIAKDPHSDAYAIGTYFSSDLAGAALPYVIHYNGKHEELGHYLVKPSGRYTFSRIQQMYVNGDKELWVATNPFNNGKNETQKAAAIQVSRLRPSDTASLLVARVMGAEPAAIWMAFNPNDQTVHLMSRYLLDHHSKEVFGPGADVVVYVYGAHLFAIDGNKMEMKYGKPVNYTMLENIRKKDYGLSNEYVGLPSSLTVGHDGIVRLTVSDGGLDFGVIEYNDQGEAAKVRYFRRRSPGTNGFFGYDFLDTKHGQFVFVNDNAANLDRDNKRAPVNQRSATSSDAFCYQLNKTGESETFLFGEGDNTFDHRFANYNITTYDEESDTYALMIMEQNGMKKKARIAWLQWQ